MKRGLIETAFGFGQEPQFSDIDFGVRYLAKLAPYDSPGWEVTSEGIPTNKNVDFIQKRGVIPVELGARILSAIPLGKNYRIIDKEFAKKYRDSVGVIVEFVNGDPSILAYSDFVFFTNNQPLDVGKDYPFKEILFFDDKLAAFRTKDFNGQLNNIELIFDIDETAKGHSLKIESAPNKEEVTFVFNTRSDLKTNNGAIIFSISKNGVTFSADKEQYFKQYFKDIQLGLAADSNVITVADLKKFRDALNLFLTTDYKLMGNSGIAAAVLGITQDIPDVATSGNDNSKTVVYPSKNVLSTPASKRE